MGSFSNHHHQSGCTALCSTLLLPSLWFSSIRCPPPLLFCPRSSGWPPPRPPPLAQWLFLGSRQSSLGRNWEAILAHPLLQRQEETLEGAGSTTGTTTTTTGAPTTTTGAPITGEARGLSRTLRRRTSPSRALSTLRSRIATRGSSAPPALVNWTTPGCRTCWPSSTPTTSCRTTTSPTRP